ncbi:peptidyl serine alpha-galactosyltransferase-like [Primulina tabacum]|uniref:peptidyl serine alpha-galactosyltransferase-like n=1 Tax=Primulina tabacum TaxID=48773 RepID=UPI003F59F4F2
MGVGILTAVLLTVLLVGRAEIQRDQEAPFRMHTLFSVECQNYFDWQTVGLMHSYRKSHQPGPITRLLSCTEEEKKTYRGMDLAPTLEVPSMSRHPKTGDWYPAINKPAGILHWLKHSKDAQNVDWVVILDADMIIRGPIVPWDLGAEKGRPVAAYYGYLVGCDNLLAKLHTKHPELCDKVGGLLAMHIDDLRALAPMWLSKTEEVRGDTAHWGTNYTGDIYGAGWISEMYGYSFGAAEVGLRHKINDNLMIYPGYVPEEGIEPILLHYGIPFSVGNWSFSKLDHHEDNIVYDCGRLFPVPPYPREVRDLERDPNKRRELYLNLECINMLNEGLLLQHSAYGCPKPTQSKYLSFLRSKTFSDLTRPKLLTPKSLQTVEVNVQKQDANESGKTYPKIHTIFSTECSPYFDWQTVGLVHSFHLSGQPGNITRLLSCTEEDLKQYKGHDLAHTHYVPSMSRHPLTGDWYPAINKPAAVVHWLNHVKTDAEYIVILDADMIMKGPITPWEFNATRGQPVSTPYNYLIGCDNELARIHTRHPEACSKVGGVIIMHMGDLRRFALLWLHKTEEVRADMGHWSRNFTGDIYEAGWISEMYGYSFGAAELNLRHVISNEILIYPGYVPAPGVKYRVLHYGLDFKVGNWSFDKANWRHADVVEKCWAQFPDPPDSSILDRSDENLFQRDLLSIECVKTLNDALKHHHKRRRCADPISLSALVHKIPDPDSSNTLTRKIPSSDSSTNLRHETPDLDLSSNPSRQATDPDSPTTQTRGTPNRPLLPFTSHKSTNEISASRKFGKIDGIDSLGHTFELNNESQGVSPPAETSQTFTSMRFWIIGLWAFSIFGFVAVMSMVIFSRRGYKKRGKTLKSKRRTSLSQDYSI